MNENDPPARALLTTRQLAERWQLEPKTILRHRKAGLIPSVTLPSGAIRYRPEEIERIENGETQ